MNVAIAYRENNLLGNVQSRPNHLKRHKSEVIVCVKNGEPYNKRQHEIIFIRCPKLYQTYQIVDKGSITIVRLQLDMKKKDKGLENKEATFPKDKP